MADVIKIQVTLEPRDIASAGKDIARQLQSALDTSVSNATAAGKKIGDALAEGVKAGLQKLQQIQGQINQVTASNAANANNAAQTAFQAHQAKLQQIAAQSLAKQNQLAQQAAIQQQNIAAQTAAKLQVIAAQTAAAQQRAAQRSQPIPGVGGAFLRNASLLREGGESIQQAGEASTRLLTTGLLSLSKAAVQSAIDIDRNISTLKAFTGSTAAAEERLQKLIAITKQTPGLTAALATTLDVTLRTANASEGAINRLIPVIGRLNAISPLGDPRKFSQNLVQLITQNFERTDLKELVGASPIAGNLIKSVFNVDSPINSEAIRASAQKLGITTIDAFANALADAAAKNPALSGVTESLATKFEKLQDRVTLALRPLGVKILESLLPAIERLIPIVEKLFDSFAKLSPQTQTLVLGLGAAAIALGPVIQGFGALVQLTGGIGNLITVIIKLNAAMTASSGASSGLASVLKFALNPALLLVAGAVVAGAVVWYEYERQIKKSTDAIDTAALNARRAAGEIDYLNNKKITVPTGPGKSVELNIDASEPLNVMTPEERAKAFGGSQKFGGFRPAAGGRLALERDPAAVAALGALSKSEIELARSSARLAATRKDFSAAENILQDALARTGKGTKEAISLETQLEQLRNRRSGVARSAAAKDVSEFDQLTKQLREAKKDVSSFQQTNSKEFGLRLDLEDARRFKAQLEEIISLRRELNEPLRAPLPTDKRGADEAIARLRAEKELRDFEKGIDIRSPFIAAQEASAAATAKQIEQLDNLITNALPKTEAATVAAALAQNQYFKALQETNPALAEYYEKQALAADATIRTTKAQEAFTHLQDQISSKLGGNTQLTEAQTIAIELQKDKYKDLTDAQREQLLVSAQQVDQQAAAQKALDETRRVAEQIGSTLTDLFTTLFEKGPKAFFDQLLSTLKRTLAQMAAQIASSAVLRLLGFGGGSGGGQLGNAGGGGTNGGILQRIASVFSPQQSGGNQSALAPGFAGGNPAGQIVNSIGGQSGGGSGLGGLLGKIPGLSKIFGGGAGAATGPSSATGAAAFGALDANGIPVGLGTQGAGAAAGGIGGSLAGLGAGGLLAGGGLLGSLAGGKSQIGKLLGGVGGSLLGGALGASGIFGGTLAGALPAFFSNPITAIVGGALIGGALLFNFFSGREQRKFRKEVENEYQLKVDGKEAGTALYKSIKALGEQTFGKGKFGKKIVDTIRLDKAQEQLAAYGEATGQENNPLVKKFRDQRGLTDKFDPRNQFPSFAYGGFVPFPDMGRDSVLTALRGQEFVTRPEIVAREGVGAFHALNEGRASIVASDGGSAQSLAFGGYVQPSRVRIYSAPSSGGQQGGGDNSELYQMVLGSNARLIQAIESFEGISEETIVRRAAQSNPDMFAGAVNQAIKDTSPNGVNIKNQVYKGR